MGRNRKTPLVWQGEMLYCHRRSYSMLEKEGQLDRRVVVGPREDVGDVAFREQSLLL